MFNFNIKIADIIIEIETEYSYTYKCSKDFITDDKNVAFSVKVTKEELEEEKKLCTGFSDGYVESVCIMKKIVNKMPDYDSFFFHGAAISLDKKMAMLFTAPSGTGKSTHISLWRKYLGDRVDIINGDKPLISVSDGTKPRICSTPWGGKEGWRKPVNAFIDAICLVQRGEINSIKKINPGDYIGVLLNQINLNREDTERLLKTFDLFNKLCERIPFYCLTCDMSEEAVKTSYEGITGMKYERSSNENARFETEIKL